MPVGEIGTRVSAMLPPLPAHRAGSLPPKPRCVLLLLQGEAGLVLQEHIVKGHPATGSVGVAVEVLVLHTVRPNRQQDQVLRSIMPPRSPATTGRRASVDSTVAS